MMSTSLEHGNIGSMPQANGNIESASLENRKTETTPIENEKTETTPIENEKTETTPKENEKIERAPKEKMVLWWIFTPILGLLLFAILESLLNPNESVLIEDLILEYVFFGGKLVLATIAVVLFHQDFSEDLKRLGRKKFLKYVIIGSLVGFASDIITGAAVNFFGLSEPENQILLNAQAESIPVLHILMAVILAPIEEEIIFRHILQTAVRKKCGAVMAILITGVLFAFAHSLVSVDILWYIVWSIAICIIYEKTGSITTVIICHALGNLLSCLL